MRWATLGSENLGVRTIGLEGGELMCGAGEPLSLALVVLDELLFELVAEHHD